MVLWKSVCGYRKSSSIALCIVVTDKVVAILLVSTSQTFIVVNENWKSSGGDGVIEHLSGNWKCELNIHYQYCTFRGDEWNICLCKTSYVNAIIWFWLWINFSDMKLIVLNTFWWSFFHLLLTARFINFINFFSYNLLKISTVIYFKCQLKY